MTQIVNQLRLVSFNCRGWNNGKSIVADLLETHDICLIQEHWLFADHLNELNFHSDILSVGVSGMDSSVLLHGRPFGGCAILFRKSLIGSVSMLSTDAKRFCAVRLTDHCGHTVLLVCVYLPTDYGTHTSHDDFLGQLEGFICSQSYDSLVIMGDFNVDFDRSGVNRSQLITFMNEYDLSAVDLCYCSINFTYENSDGSAKSWLDPVLSSRSFVSRFLSVLKVDVACNLSDHHTLSSLLDFSISSILQVSDLASSQFTPRTAWHKVSDFDLQCYRDRISTSLPSIPADLISCSDPACRRHQGLLHCLCSSLFQCIYHSAKSALPVTKSRNRSVPGWNDAAKRLKTAAGFWHRLWREAGSPSAGVLHQLKLATKRRYKYEVRRLKRQQSVIRRRRMAQALANPGSRNFWKEVKNINRSCSRKAAHALS